MGNSSDVSVLRAGGTVEVDGVVYRMTKDGDELVPGDLYLGQRRQAAVVRTVGFTDGIGGFHGAVYAAAWEPFTYAFNKSECVGVEKVA